MNKKANYLWSFWSAKGAPCSWTLPRAGRTIREEAPGCWGEKKTWRSPECRLLLCQQLSLLSFSYKSLIIPSVSLGVFSVCLSLEPMLYGPTWSLSCRLTCPRHGAGQSGSRCWGHCVSQCVTCSFPQGLRKDAHIEVTVSEALISMCLNNLLLAFFFKIKTKLLFYLGESVSDRL